MSSFLIPSIQAVTELRRTHERTFAIELKQGEPFILYLKLTPTQTLSIINGAPIDLIIGSPLVQPNTISFRLHDVVGAPFWISRKFAPTMNANHATDLVTGLPFISQQLAQASSTQIGLFDWDTKCIHTEVVPISRPDKSLHEWIETHQATQSLVITNDQKLEYGYVLRLGPLVSRPDFWYTNIAFQENVGDKPYLVSTNKYSDSLRTSEYLEEGKHGYYQEHFLTVELAKYFRAGVDLFISPRTHGKTELTDFVIAAHGVIILIESKASSPYEGVPRNVDTVERALTRLVRKAFEQLYKAREVVTENPLSLADARLSEKCARATAVVSICIVDDALMINAHSLAVSLRQLGKPARGLTPCILEIEDFFGLLAHFQSTRHLIDVLMQLSQSVPPDAEMPLLHIGFE